MTNHRNFPQSELHRPLRQGLPLLASADVGGDATFQEVNLLSNSTPSFLMLIDQFSFLHHKEQIFRPVTAQSQGPALPSYRLTHSSAALKDCFSLFESRFWSQPLLGSFFCGPHSLLGKVQYLHCGNKPVLHKTGFCPAVPIITTWLSKSCPTNRGGFSLGVLWDAVQKVIVFL